MTDSRLHILVGTAIGGIVALFLVFMGVSFSRVSFTLTAFVLTLLGAWLGLKSSSEAKRRYELKRQVLEDAAGYYKQHAIVSRAASEARKARHDLGQVGKHIQRTDELETTTHETRRLEHLVAQGGLRGQLDEHRTSVLEQVLRRVGLRRKIAAARSPEMIEMEEAIQRGVEAVEDVVTFGTEKIREFSARSDVDEATKEAWIRIVNNAVAGEVKRRLEKGRG